MAQIIWTESALSDLDDIAEYIALDKVEAACRLVKHVFKNVGELEHFPELGRKPPELENSTYREIIVNPCRIFYRLDQNENIYILYVMRGERQLRKYLLDERAQDAS
ncbi:type II toxin-antitoxin system RelE/ParE family toxin [Methylicorpusculum oleiharenae]|uniref:type II toxin-antitoxin system RelE/ParE family toxin n=1 Tax=Methylicorpusculum oleiharenae TaxID=1338687 RepID=UPI0013595133|nr:type II toxin-antitoxin system RelE/ParE family toxin [Methylicorpusculum oleiharenae]MCD2448849.1 type II toxin-antitoxin system RelE/ParE family toxin [Methylicorpusculum oleiharenae]